MNLYINEIGSPYAHNSNVFIHSGSDLDIRCDITDISPQVVVTWTVNNVNVNEHSDSSATDLGNGAFNYSSYIRDIDADDCLQVTCTASNDVIEDLGQQSDWIRIVNIYTISKIIVLSQL